MRGGQSTSELSAARDALVREGINPSAADLSVRAANTANQVERNVAGAGMFGADGRAVSEGQIARAITSRIGAPSDELSSAVVKRAQQNVSKLYDDALDGVDVSVGPQFAQTLDDIAARHSSTTLPSLASRLPANIVEDLKDVVSKGAIPARQLQAIRSSIGREMSSGNDTAAKASLGEIRAAIDDALQQNLPAPNLTKFNQANEQYKNLQVAENYVRRMNDSGDFNAKRFLTSVKAENKAAFERGDAPFQDLIGNLAASSADGPSIGGVDALTKAVGLGALTGPAAPVATGLAGNLALRILTDPKYRDVLLGLNPVQRAGLMQQAAGASAAVGGQTAQSLAPKLPPMPTAQVIPLRRAA